MTGNTMGSILLVTSSGTCTFPAMQISSGKLQQVEESWQAFAGAHESHYLGYNNKYWCLFLNLLQFAAEIYTKVTIQ